MAIIVTIIFRIQCNNENLSDYYNLVPHIRNVQKLFLHNYYSFDDRFPLAKLVAHQTWKTYDRKKNCFKTF